MHLTTNALVLREVNYKESDKILTLLTEKEGKLTVSARGCRKKDSPIASACQLLAWGEFTLYEYNGRWAVKETASERLFDGVRGIWRKSPWPATLWRSPRPWPRRASQTPVCWR